jgi:hypothetical protein
LETKILYHTLSAQNERIWIAERYYLDWKINGRQQRIGEKRRLKYQMKNLMNPVWSKVATICYPQ